MKNRFLFLILGLSAAVFLLDACKPKEDENEDLINTYNRRALLQNLSDNYIVPGYSGYSASVLSLESAYSVLVANPTAANLDVLKSSYKTLALNWQKVAFLEFGPGEDISLRAQTNVYPVDTSLINSNITSGSFNLAQVSNFQAKGIQTLDYLFFQPQKNNSTDLITYLTSSNVQTYVKAVVKDLKDNAEYVKDGWNTYKSTFVSNSESNADGSGMSIIVNAYSIHYEAYVRKGKLGLPSGAFNGFSQQAMPGHVEAYYSGYSLELLKESVLAMERFLQGVSYEGNSDGEGLMDYLNHVLAKKGDAGLALTIQNQFKSINNGLNELSGELSDQVISNAAKVKEVYDELQKMVPLIKVDLTASLGVLITYQDTDGD